MTMGEYIKKCRTGNNKYGKMWSQDELGHSLNPPVNRSAVNKWEMGTVENIKRCHIEQMAEMFGITPADLMCFESRFDEGAISEELAVIESVQKLFGRSSVQVLQYFNELNEFGKEKALNDILDMLELPKYTKSSRCGSR